MSGFWRGIWEFVVGDDWRVAAGIVAMLGATAALAGLGLPSWWLGPIATLEILRRAVRRAGSPSHSSG
jgi:hypothetical protein